MRKYVFGPIRSRRLGSSLGVDLVPAKTCPLDCIYCEARATTDLTVERREYVDIEAVLSELDETLRSIPAPDYVTFSGAGEPTLNSGIGRVIDFIKEKYPFCRVCLLTNGLLLGDGDVQRAVAKADLVIPSLDASCEAEYQQINRPASGETFEKLVKGLVSFRQQSTMKVALEIFIVPGINDSAASIGRFAALVREISPDLVQLNTLDRPGAVENIVPATAEKMAEFARAIGKFVPVETVNPSLSPQLPHNLMSDQQQ